jgi:NTE family protein
MAHLEGIIPALLTPIGQDGEVAVRPLERLLERLYGTGVHGMYVCGQTGEGLLQTAPMRKRAAEVVMASAALPFVFKAVEIDGVPYWDGGYMGNPAIFPFFGATETEDVLLVQINPIERRATPRTQVEILNRINEITFNSSLLAEYRAIDFVIRLIDQGKLPRGMGPGQYRRINLHRIALDGIFGTLTADSKMETDYDFFQMLHDGGRRAAQDFLHDHFDDIGRRSTFDLQAESKAEWA